LASSSSYREPQAHGPVHVHQRGASQRSKREVLPLLGKSRDQQDGILKELEEEKEVELARLERTQAVTQEKGSMGAEKEERA
jgi:hypothetical protein